MSAPAEKANSAVGDKNEWLVRFAVTNLLDYILDTENLSVIRGSSVQLEEFVDAEAKEICRRHSSVAIIYAKASEMLLSVPDQSSAEKVKKNLEVQFKKELPFATAATVIARHGETPRDIERALRRQQLSRPSVVPAKPMNGTRDCEIEGVRPADGGTLQYGDGKLRTVCQHVKSRYELGREFRRGLLRTFSAEATFRLKDKSEVAKALGGGTLTLAVGAVFCNTHEPIRRAHELAQNLAERAKEASRRAPYDAELGNAMDFLVVESGFVPQDLSAHREQMLSGAWLKRQALTRPELESLVSNVRDLKKASFPKTRVHELARVVSESKSAKEAAEACSKILVRARTEQPLPKELVPERLPESSPVIDFICWLERHEIWDYVAP